MENVLLTRDEILNKDFKKTRIGTGYDMTDVDAFLDEIMADYQAYETNIQELTKQNDKLKAQVAELTKQVAAAQQTSGTPNQAVSPAPVANTNMDILKRLSNLERRVFGTARTNENASATTTGVTASRVAANAQSVEHAGENEEFLDNQATQAEK
ncbi:cell division regulator GpsB [Weissella halotolerans]|nr:cell division regulator GpsB [Weissella halotolerans]